MNKLFCIILTGILLWSCNTQSPKEEQSYPNNKSVKPWTFWYWMHGEVSKEGITADLEAMKEVGLGGTYLFPIKDVRDSSFIDKPVRTLTPEWWQMVQFAMEECKRLDLKLGMHACDGFTCAAGPWITPEKSMQKIVYSDTIVAGGKFFNGELSVPGHKENYYEDIAIYAIPFNDKELQSSYKIVPKVSTDIPNSDLNYLALKTNNKQFRSKTPCYIQYEFEQPFNCRSITIKTGWNNYHSNRLMIQVSNDGIHFSDHHLMVPPRLGWEDLYANATHLIPAVSARFFRFVYNPDGMEPGAEDLDDAKWKPALRLKGIELSSETKIHQFEGKTAAIWRVAKRTSSQEISSNECVSLNSMLNITENLSDDGTLSWDMPKGNWRILRMGHTSTGTTNYIGGGGKGLECDKLNPEVVRFQFDQWFGEIFRQVGPELAHKVLKRFHIDSWECGSQNWTPVLRDEFIQRRGYDYYKYLPLMAGIPIENAETSERVLSDLRETIAELIADNFYKEMARKAHEMDCLFSAESVSPVMVADGMLHFREVDLPMGEFWFRSPSHDKPNDILDAISGAHIYGKKIIQSESLTEIRLDWDEHPGMLKPVIDRNFALGINKIFFHVFTHNPWVDRKPGMTLDVVGTYFQRDQTWWKQGKAFIDYLTNCQSQLQKGNPVVDIAVFTGEEVPRRSILPDRLVDILPGIMGEERVKSEEHRLQNNNFESRHMPHGVTTLDNMADPWEWINPLMGYAYDSFNKDALLQLAKVDNGDIVLPGGARYKVLVVPGKRKMTPDGDLRMSLEVATKLLDLVKQGATILMMDKPAKTYGLDAGKEEQLAEVVNVLFGGESLQVSDKKGNDYKISQVGKGNVITGPFTASSFEEINLSKDFIATNGQGKELSTLAWNHRTSADEEIYFVSNQKEVEQSVTLSFRQNGKTPIIYNPVTGVEFAVADFKENNGRTELKYDFVENESAFIIFKSGVGATESISTVVAAQSIEGDWLVTFDSSLGGPSEAVTFNKLTSWNKHSNEAIKYFSGTAVYQNSFEWTKGSEGEAWINLGDFDNIAEVKVNGQSCGVCWTKPHKVNITKAVKEGNNKLEIEITNTWANRLMGDHNLPQDKRVTWTTAPYRLKGRDLLPAGLYGPVKIETYK